MCVSVYECVCRYVYVVNLCVCVYVCGVCAHARSSVNAMKFKS